MKLPFVGCSLKEYPAGSCTQFHGENPALYARMGLAGHNGIDLVAPHGTQMYAVEDGTVVDVNNNPEGYGRHFRFMSKPVKGIARVWTYGHCDAVQVKVGDIITEGQPVATMGNTGFVVSAGYASTFWGNVPGNTKGTHLHLGLRKVQVTPKGWAYLGSTIKMLAIDLNNGFKASIDPVPFLKDATEPVVDNSKLELQISLLTQVLNLWKQLKGIK